MSKFLKTMIVLVTMLALTACSLFTHIKENSEVVELVTRAAVGRVLTEHPSMVEPTYKITSDAILFIESGTVTEIGELEAFVVEKIDWAKLTSEEKDITLFLIGQIKADLKEKLALRGVSDPDGVQVVLVEVLSWINQTAAIRRSSAMWFGIDLDSILAQAAIDTDRKLRPKGDGSIEWPDIFTL